MLLKKKKMKKAVKSLSLKRRINSPSPTFFNKIKKFGLILSGVGTAILASPVVLPAILTSLAGYLVTTGLVASAVAVVTVEEKAVK
jgi:uncharacterized membrane protein